MENLKKTFEPLSAVTVLSRLNNSMYCVLLAAILLLQQAVHAQTITENCFGDYGSCTQEVILPLFAASGCLCSSASCACSDETYLFGVMAQVGACCTFTELNDTAQTSIDNCINNGSPSIVSFKELLDAGKAATASACTIAGLATQKASPNSSQTSSPTFSSATSAVTTESSTNPASSPGGDNGGGYSTSDKIALGVGIGVGLPATIAAVLTLWLLCIRG